MPSFELYLQCTCNFIVSVCHIHVPRTCAKSTREPVIWPCDAHLRMTVYRIRRNNYPDQHPTMNILWIITLYGKVMLRKIKEQKPQIKPKKYGNTIWSMAKGIQMPCGRVFQRIKITLRNTILVDSHPNNVFGALFLNRMGSFYLDILVFFFYKPITKAGI